MDEDDFAFWDAPYSEYYAEEYFVDQDEEEDDDYDYYPTSDWDYGGI